jgi:drug/metabolite transporter (DMT)-like permease
MRRTCVPGSPGCGARGTGARLTSNPRLGILLALLGAVFSACFLIPWKVATEHGDPKEATLVLLLTAALLNTLGTGVVPPEQAGPSEAPLRPTLLLALVFAVLSLLGNYFSAAAVQRLSGALLAVLQRCEVLVVALLGAVVLGEHVKRSFWAGVAIAIAGLAVLAQPAEGAAQGVDLLGVLFGIGSAVCFGTMAVLTRKYISRIRPVFLNALRLWLGVLLWFAVERGLPARAAIPPGLVIGAALAGFFGPFLSRLCAMYSARYVAASTTALAGLITPVLTLLFGMLVLGELPTPRAMIGGAIMLAGIAIPLFGIARERA